MRWQRVAGVDAILGEQIVRCGSVLQRNSVNNDITRELFPTHSPSASLHDTYHLDSQSPLAGPTVTRVYLHRPALDLAEERYHVVLDDERRILRRKSVSRGTSTLQRLTRLTLGPFVQPTRNIVRPADLVVHHLICCKVCTSGRNLNRVSV